jgi:hypothetical protein
MSAASDRYERDVAKSMDMAIKAVDRKGEALRLKASTEYADIRLNCFGIQTWCEVKMNHTDNLSNPRVFYEGRKWHTTYTTPAAQYTVELLNDSRDAKKFIKDISDFSGIHVNEICIPTTKSGLKSKYAVPLATMKKFFSQPGMNRYIAKEKNFNLGKVVTEHYTIGKAEPAYYMQADNDFYLISNSNPLGMRGIPILKGKGDFKVRVATRASYYEVQAEIKIKDMGNSPFSLAPKTTKKNPFDTIK